MRSRFFSLAAHFYAPKLPEVLGCSDLILYSQVINHTYLYSRLHKYANSPKLLELLDRLGTPEDVKQFVLSQPPNLVGPAIGQINKNKTITKIELESFIQQIMAKEELKQKTKEDIANQFPPETPAPIRPWLVIQIKKYPNLKDGLLQHAKDIENFIVSHDQDIFSYTAPDMLKALEEQKSGANGSYDSVISQFFGQVKMKEYETVHTEYAALQAWFLKNFLRIRKEWKNNIEKTMVKENKTFEQLIAEAKSLYDAQQRGDLRGKEMPHSPLHNGEHSSLLINYENIKDWYTAIINEDKDFNIKKISPADAVKFSKQWHEEEANKGAGRQYDPINRANIVYGPSNWKNEEYNGHFILELKSANDLKVEGFKMNHCVGGYCSQVDNGTSRIFSLRNAAAPKTPIITIETDGSAGIIRQDYGPGNSKIQQVYHEMVSEWNLGNSSNIDVLKLDSWELQRLLENGRIHPDHMLKLVDHPERYVRENLAKAPNTPEPIIEKLCEDLSADVRTLIAKRENLPERFIIKLCNDEHRWVREVIAARKDLTETAINILVKDTNDNVRANIALNMNLTEPAIEALSKDTRPFVITKFLLNPSIPINFKKDIDTSKFELDNINDAAKGFDHKLDEDTIAMLAKSPNIKMRQYIAGASRATFDAKLFDLPENLLTDLANDPSEHVRASMAEGRTNLPPDILNHLMADKSKKVLTKLLVFQDLDSNAIRNIANNNDLNAEFDEDDRDVYRGQANNRSGLGYEMALASHEATPDDVLTKLFQKASNDSGPPKLDADGNPKFEDRRYYGNTKELETFWSAILTNNNLPEPIISEAFKNRRGTSASYAANKSTPGPILEEIYELDSSNHYSGDETVKGLITNPQTPSHILLKIYQKRQGYRFAKDFLSNHNTPKPVLKDIYENSKEVPYRMDDLEKLFIANPNTPLPILKSLYYRGKGFAERIDNIIGFANNPGTPSSVLQNMYDVLVGASHVFKPEDLEKILLLLSSNPHTPSQIIGDIYRGHVNMPSIGEKALRDQAIPFIALNTASPTSVLKELMRSKDVKIATDAKETLIRVSQIKKDETKPQYMRRRDPRNVDELSEEDLDTYWPWGNKIPEREPTYDSNDHELNSSRDDEDYDD